MKKRNSTCRTIQQRRDFANEKKVERDKRTYEQQLQVLDDRLGENVGAAKERASLLRAISDRKAAKPKNQNKKNKTADKNKRKRK